MSDEPLVTCLCLTMAGRKWFLRRAIESFDAQTYPNRELLIVPDSWDDLNDLTLGLIDCDRPISVYVPNSKLNVGEKRNRGCESSRRSSRYIAVWDDDDVSAPERLSFQVDLLQKTGKAVTGFREMMFSDGLLWHRFSYPPRGLVFGTSLLFDRSWWAKHHFLDINVGEDSGFCEVAAADGQLVEVSDSGLMFATIHSGNTSVKRVDQAGWEIIPGFLLPLCYSFLR